MSATRKRAPRFRVGDPVRFLYGTEKVAGEILDDRGPLGEYGRRLYRVRINAGRDDESSFEIPEEDIKRRDLSATVVELLDCARNLTSRTFGGHRRTSGRPRRSAASCIKALKQRAPSATRLEDGKASKRETRIMQSLRYS